MTDEARLPEPPIDADDRDVVLSSRVRLARNLSGQPFLNRATETQCAHIVRTTQHVLLNSSVSEKIIWIDLDEINAHDRNLLVERHLISRNLAESTLHRGVAISGDERLSVMVNEEDHLRIQVLRSGSNIESAFQQVRATDIQLEQQLDFAFSDRWGYLAVCPTNVGTGIRFSIMVHLPGLRITNELGKVRRAAKELHLAVRGYYGEGSESSGNIFQISNQVTLGSTEEDLRDIFTERIVPALLDYERSSRQVLLKRNPTLLDDRVHRALNILRSARLLKVEEAMKLISRVRLGVCLERLDVPLQQLDDLFIQIQPAHLRQHVNCALDAEEELEIRATLVREVLKGVS